MTVGMADSRDAGAWSAASIAVSAMLAFGLLVATILAAASSAGGVAVINAAEVAAGSIDTEILTGDGTAVGIAVNNLSAIGLLAAGAPLLGSTTFAGIALIGIGVGISAASIVEALGPMETLLRIAPYVVFEAAGVVLAATSGLVPTVHALLRSIAGRQGFGTAFVDGLALAIRIIAMAAVLILLGAITESLVIARGI